MKIRLRLLLPLLLHVAVITAVASFGSQSRVTGFLHQPHHLLSVERQQQSLQHHFGLLDGRRQPAARLNVALADIQADLDMPELGNDGIYHLMDERQHKALLDHHKDKIVVLKIFAPWCKACKGLEPKFNAMVRDEKYSNLPLVWADLTIQNNKDFVKSIGVLALPTIQFYARSQVLDTFPCGPSKVPILKRKLVQLINERVDASTYQLKENISADTMATQDEESVHVMAKSSGVIDLVVESDSSEDTVAPRRSAMATDDIERKTAEAPAKSSAEESLERLLQRNKSMLRSNRYLSELLESEFETLLTKANLLTFESGSLIMKEGNPGRTFYILLEGEVEICQHTSFEDPLTTPPSYLGTVINRQDRKGDYFGERSMITGEPRAASIRATSRTQCLTFDKDDFPRTSVLSGHAVLVDDVSKEKVLNEVNDKYGKSLTDVNQLNGQKQYQDSITASQVRGSVNNPRIIDGVDNDKEVDQDIAESVSVPKLPVQANAINETGASLRVEPESIVPLLMRFKLIRSITRCFDYVVQNRLVFGDSRTLRRRTMLAKMLSQMQLQSITEAFKLVDEDGDGEITLMELRRIMDSVGEERSDHELLDVIETSKFSSLDGKTILTEEDFTGIMAEAEIYHLFLDTFKALDKQNSGFVRAKDLDRVLCGIRDLISDDRHSIIDVEDKEMMVDYEQFSRMLLGTSLKV